jgi:hypothetical protein
LEQLVEDTALRVPSDSILRFVKGVSALGTLVFVEGASIVCLQQLLSGSNGLIVDIRIFKRLGLANVTEARTLLRRRRWNLSSYTVDSHT